MSNAPTPRPNARTIRSCQWCEQPFSARDMVAHKPRCPRKPQRPKYEPPRKTDQKKRRITCRRCGATDIAANFFQAHMKSCPGRGGIPADFRFCVVCQDAGPGDLFYASPIRKLSTCKICAQRRANDWYAANRAHRRQSLARKLYGLEPEQHASLLERQGGVCAICGLPPTGGPKNERLHVDHDHATGKVRGLLCTLCNQGIGEFHDDPGLLLKAIDYLRRHRPIPVVA